MNVSMKSEYGLRALIELSLRYGEGPVQSDVIADAQDIPERFLEQILTTMRRAGFIRSIRGSRGGHALIRDPGELRLSEVILSLEGSPAPISCMEEGGVCYFDSSCLVRPVWQEVEAVTFQILNAMTIAELADQEREKVGLRDRYAI